MSCGVFRAHSMPFGAELLEDGHTRFRLWAPDVAQVQLRLENKGEHLAAGAPTIPMLKQEQGWFELIHPNAVPGSLYGYVLPDGLTVPDPASRYQPRDIHDLSEVIDPKGYTWKDESWIGRSWHEAVIYELHTGTFSPGGDFAGIGDYLPHLIDLGITAIELMPVADFPGTRNWGYDSAYLFAPDSIYGRPEDLKALIDTAHQHGIMVIMDVVYNHFGPEGNYLHTYAETFFTDKHQTPWGKAINFDQPGSEWVRQFFIHNALYWLEEYHLDGLRFDAVHAIKDDSRPHILEHIAQTVHEKFGGQRQIHLILENDANESRYLIRDHHNRPAAYTAQWNDDIHHAFHVVATGESSGYYADYSNNAIIRLGRALAEGFIYQGDPSAYRGGENRGEISAHLPPLAFISFHQNHDQIGNRAYGDRIHNLSTNQRMQALTAILLLSPQVPLLFMGQEWSANEPFLFFCDFSADLNASVREGRRCEFSAFPEFSDPVNLSKIPDPCAAQTFERSKLDWSGREQAGHREWLHFYRHLLQIRHHSVEPLLPHLGSGHYDYTPDHGLSVYWTHREGSKLHLWANLSDSMLSFPETSSIHPIYRSTHPGGDARSASWSTQVWFETPAG